MAKRATRAKKKNKSEAIRALKHSNEAMGPKEIAETLNKKGYKVTAQFVSTVLSNERRKTGVTGTRGRRPAAGKGGELTVDQLLVAKSFVQNMGGADAAKAGVDAYARLSK